MCAHHRAFEYEKGGASVGPVYGVVVMDNTLDAMFPKQMWQKQQGAAQIARLPVASDARDRLRGNRSDTCRRLERCTFYD